MITTDLPTRKRQAEAIYMAAEACEDGEECLPALRRACETVGVDYSQVLGRITRTLRRDPRVHRAYRSWSAAEYLKDYTVPAAVDGVRLLRRAGWWLSTGHAPDEPEAWQS